MGLKNLTPKDFEPGMFLLIICLLIVISEVVL